MTDHAAYNETSLVTGLYLSVVGCRLTEELSKLQWQPRAMNNTSMVKLYRD